jgi:hypothetical protein
VEFAGESVDLRELLGRRWLLTRVDFTLFYSRLVDSVGGVYNAADKVKEEPSFQMTQLL